MTELVARLSPEEITDLARKVVANRVFIAWDPEAERCAFGGYLMLVSGGLQAQGEDVSWMDDIGWIYQDWDRAGPTSLNGYPTFLSAQFTHKDDRYLIQRECIRLAVALGTATQEQLDKFDADYAEYERKVAEAAQE